MHTYERETSIWYNEAEEGCNVYTHSKSLISKLDKLCKTRPAECKIHRLITDDESVAKEYVVPKSWISVRPPKVMNYTDEQRQELSERMKLLHDKDTVHKTEGK